MSTTQALNALSKRKICASCLRRLNRDASNLPPAGIATIHRRHISASRRKLQDQEFESIESSPFERSSGIRPRVRRLSVGSQPSSGQDAPQRTASAAFGARFSFPERPSQPQSSSQAYNGNRRVIRFGPGPQYTSTDDAQPLYDPVKAANWQNLKRREPVAPNSPERAGISTTRGLIRNVSLGPSPKLEKYQKESEDRWQQSRQGGRVAFRRVEPRRRPVEESSNQDALDGPFGPGKRPWADQESSPGEHKEGHSLDQTDDAALPRGPSPEETERMRRMHEKELDNRSRRSRRSDEDSIRTRKFRSQANRRDRDDEDDLSRRPRKSRQSQDDDLDVDMEQEKRKRERKEQRKREKAEKAAAAKQALEAAQSQPPVYLPEFISVSNLAGQLKKRAEQVVLKMQQLGFDNAGPDQVINAENAAIVAMEYNFEPIIERADEDIHAASVPEDKSTLPARPPVVTIMGHVDHGKTTILDYLRKTAVVETEHGGITQHIGAFSVPLSSGKAITFLDTPGHAAFLSMRARGANVTDIVVLVVAGDDSVKPQTLEAIKHANAARVPIIVAINKMDRPDANAEKVKQDLARHDITVEDYGGDTQVVLVSGKTGMGMSDLEDAILLQSEVLDHRAPETGNVEGWIIEAQTKDRGRVATILVRRGTLVPGTIIVAGRAWARVRSLRNDKGVTVDSAGPGMPIEVDGWREPPSAGDEVLEAKDEGHATKIIDFREEKAERVQMALDVEAINEARRLETERREREEAAARAAADGSDLTEEAKQNSQSDTGITVPLIIKADVSGSAEAVNDSLQQVGNHEVQPRILRSAVGSVAESDVVHASSASGHIVNFNMPLDPHIVRLANELNVRILDHNIIYRLTDDIKEVLSEKLPPRISHKVLGEAEVSQIFEISVRKEKHRIAGCKVRNGNIKRDAKVKVMRGDREVIFDGALSSLKHVKKDVPEMGKGSECGMDFEKWQDFEVGDQVQCYQVIEEKRYL